jgi:hypothetical protein
MLDAVENSGIKVGVLTSLWSLHRGARERGQAQE